MILDWRGSDELRHVAHRHWHDQDQDSHGNEDQTASDNPPLPVKAMPHDARNCQPDEQRCRVQVAGSRSVLDAQRAAVEGLEAVFGSERQKGGGRQRRWAESADHRNCNAHSSRGQQQSPHPTEALRRQPHYATNG